MIEPTKSAFYSKENLEKVTYAIRETRVVMDHYGRQFNGTKPSKRIRALVDLFNRMANNLDGVEILLDHPQITYPYIPFQAINTLLRPVLHDVFVAFYIGSIKNEDHAETELDILNLDLYTALTTIKNEFKEYKEFDSSLFDRITSEFIESNPELFQDREKRNAKSLRPEGHVLGNGKIVVSNVLKVLKHTDLMQLKELYAMYRLLSQYEHYSPWFQKSFAYKDDFEFGTIVQTMYSAIYAIVLIGGAISMDDKGMYSLLRRAEELKGIIQ